MLMTESSCPVELSERIMHRMDESFWGGLGKMFGFGGGNQQAAPSPMSPGMQAGLDAMNNNQADAQKQKQMAAFNQKHGDTFTKVKNDFVQAMQGAAKQVQQKYARMPNAKMIVTAVEALARNAASSAMKFQFKPGGGQAADQFFQGFQQQGQQQAIMQAVQSGNIDQLLSMPGDMIANAIEGQPQMKQQLQQAAMKLNKDIQAAGDPATKQQLQGKLKKLMGVIKHGMGAEYVQGTKKNAGANQAVQKTATTNREKAQQKQQWIQNWTQNLSRMPMEGEAEEAYQKFLQSRGGATMGAPQPAVPAGAPTMRKFMAKEHNLFIESLVRGAGKRPHASNPMSM